MKKIINILCISLLAFASITFSRSPDEAVSANSIGAVPYKDQSVIFGIYKFVDGPEVYGPLVSSLLIGHGWKSIWDDDNKAKNSLKDIELTDQKIKLSNYIKNNLQGPFLGTLKNIDYQHDIKLFIWEMSQPAGTFDVWRVGYAPFDYRVKQFVLGALESAKEVKAERFYTVITLPPLYDTEYKMATAFWDAFKKTPLMKGLAPQPAPATQQVPTPKPVVTVPPAGSAPLKTPTDPVAGSLTAFADALNKLAPQIKP